MNSNYFLEYNPINCYSDPLSILINNEIHVAIRDAYNSLSYSSRELIDYLILSDFSNFNQINTVFKKEKIINELKKIFLEIYS